MQKNRLSRNKLCNSNVSSFSGLMLPVLEDSVLAERAAEGTLTIKDLLLYSAVCGTGLDTVPLAGDINANQISSILMDLAALSLRLDKPLTARLMPIPGKKAGDLTELCRGCGTLDRTPAANSATCPAKCRVAGRGDSWGAK